MKERPILFSAPMVRALLAGTKTQTRRVVKPPPGLAIPSTMHMATIRGVLVAMWPDIAADGYSASNMFRPVRCPYGEPGDRLWVKESFRLRQDQDSKPPSQDWWKSGAWYAADGVEPSGCDGGPGRLRPSIHMPRWASRLTLEVTDVRVQRLRDISEEDAKAEGVTPRPKDPEGDCWSGGGHRRAFEYLWGEINGFDGEPKARAPWSTNPWLWCLTFKRVEQEARGAA